MELVTAGAMTRIVCIGEAMVELGRAGDGWIMRYGGDTLNTAIHLARSGHDTAYLTALGVDPFSADLRAQWQAEGLDCSLLLTHPTRQVGLYAISTDAAGERSFHYWRDTSAARAMYESPGVDQALDQAARADLLSFSLISLAILSSAHRAALLNLAQDIRNRGGQIAFDGNYRPALWPNKEEAIVARDAAISCATIGLPTLEDERLLSGQSDADAVAAHWRQLGCEEVIVKLGADGCRLPDGTIVPPPRVESPVDTSGAGDAFNGGYLAARMRGLSVAQAADLGQFLAAKVIMRAGAIPHVPEWKDEWARSAL